MSENAPMELGRVGVWLGQIAGWPTLQETAAARELEASGYAALWFGESPTTREAFVHAGLLLAATERVTVATGIASIWARTPVASASAASTLAEAYPGRFVLGLGVSHAPLVRALGLDYAQPLTAMRKYLDAMDAAQAGREAPPRVLAALGPKMLELARERAAGAHPYLTTPRHTAAARRTLGDGRFLAPEQAFVLESGPARARAIARKHLEPYLALENYRRSWLRDGFRDDDLSSEGSDRLVDELVAWGDEAAVRSHIERHFEAGADHVVLQACGPEPVQELRSLASALEL